MRPLLEFRNVTIFRGERRVLDSLSLAIGEREHVAILGPNGSGKSTLIKAITRECYPYHAGPDSWVRILDRETWNVFELRELLGIVTNDLAQACTREFTGREIVLSGFFSAIGVWPHHQVTAAMEDKAAEVLRLLEIEELADRPVDEMSSGEARRIVIARALVHDPKALVLDEPTTSLDLRAYHEIRETLRRIAQSGTSIILVTHHLPDIVPEIGRVVVMSHGRIVEDGAKADVLDRTKLSRLFGVPLEVIAAPDGYYHVM
jgi:iron complex transport system ATP-binding protein